MLQFYIRRARPQQKETENVVVFENPTGPTPRQLPPASINESSQSGGPGKHSQMYTDLHGKEQEIEATYETPTELGYESPQNN